MTYRLTDREAACQYFQSSNLAPRVACSPGSRVWSARFPGEQLGPKTRQTVGVRYSLVRAEGGGGEEFIVSPDGRRIGVVRARCTVTWISCSTSWRK